MAQNQAQNQTLPSITKLTSEFPYVPKPDPEAEHASSVDNAYHAGVSRQQSMYVGLSTPSGMMPYGMADPDARQRVTCDTGSMDPNRMSQNSDIRDSGNWSQSKHSSTVSSNPGLQLQTILNSEESPSRISMPPDTPHSARAQQPDVPQSTRVQQPVSIFKIPKPPRPVTYAHLQPIRERPSLPSVHQGFGEHPRQSLEAKYDTDMFSAERPPQRLEPFPMSPDKVLRDTHESRRSSVDSRMNSVMGHLAISPSSPYDSQNVSRASLVSNLQQQRGIADARANGSMPVSPLSSRFNRAAAAAPRQAKRAPVIKEFSGMPDPTSADPTPGYPWAFPDAPEQNEHRRSSSGDSSMEQSGPSRQNSFAPSINSSIMTADSHLPPGQKRFEDEDIQHTHHHSMQHRAVANLQSDGQVAAGSGNYSRTPELRVSHKMAERKRRSEMKSLFDELNNILPNTPGGKSSKWEVLTKAIEHIRALKIQDGQQRRENEQLRVQTEYGRRLEEENSALKNELGTCWSHLQRVEPNNHHVFGQFTNSLAVDSATGATAGPATGAASLHHQGQAQARLPPLSGSGVQATVHPFRDATGGATPMEGLHNSSWGSARPY